MHTDARSHLSANWDHGNDNVAPAKEAGSQALQPLPDDARVRALPQLNIFGMKRSRKSCTLGHSHVARLNTAACSKYHVALGCAAERQASCDQCKRKS